MHWIGWVFTGFAALMFLVSLGEASAPGDEFRDHCDDCGGVVQDGECVGCGRSFCTECGMCDDGEDCGCD